MCNVTILNSLEDARHEIESALARGDVPTTLATVQCLWAFCGDRRELDRVLEGVHAAIQHHPRLSPQDARDLNWGLDEVKLTASKEHLLAVA